MSGRSTSRLSEAQARYVARLREAHGLLATAIGTYRDIGGGAALEEVRALVHRLAGAAGSFGFTEISARAEAADVAAKALIAGEGDPARLSALVDEVLAALERVDAG